MTTLIKDIRQTGPNVFCSTPGTSSPGHWPNSPRGGRWISGA